MTIPIEISNRCGIGDAGANIISSRREVTCAIPKSDGHHISSHFPIDGIEQRDGSRDKVQMTIAIHISQSDRCITVSHGNIARLRKISCTVTGKDPHVPIAVRDEGIHTSIAVHIAQRSSKHNIEGTTFD